MQWTDRMAGRRFYPAVLALALVLSGAASPAKQEKQDNEGFLVGVLIKALALKEQALAEIRMNDQELQTSELIFQEAETRMTIAMETHNRQAAWDAREPLEKARAERKKLKETGVRLELDRTRAEASFAAVRHFLLSGQGKGPDSRIRGLASLCAGKAEILRKGGPKLALKGGRPSFLEPGDELITVGESSAEVHALNGRGVIRLGEHSRLKLEDDGPEGQTLRLFQGKIYAVVDSTEVFADLLSDGGGQFESETKLEEALARTRERAKEMTDKKLTVPTPNACCSAGGARFTVEIMKSGGTEVVVFEAAAEVGDAGCSDKVALEQGFKVLVTREGITEPGKAAGGDKWWEK
jgi:hypothetical protein